MFLRAYTLLLLCTPFCIYMFEFIVYVNISIIYTLFGTSDKYRRQKDTTNLHEETTRAWFLYAAGLSTSPQELCLLSPSADELTNDTLARQALITQRFTRAASNELL